jgi:hypothetical protein
MVCHTGNTHPSRVQVDEKEHVVGDRAAHRPDGLGKEVRCPDRLKMPLYEFCSTAVPTFRPWIEAVILQKPFDGCARDTVDAEFLEFPQDSALTPASCFSHVENQLPDLLRFPQPSPLAGSFPRPAFSEPAGKGSRMDDGNDLLEPRAEPHAELQQFGPFRRDRFDSFGQSAAKHAVLGLEILDHLDQFLLRRTPRWL